MVGNNPLKSKFNMPNFDSQSKTIDDILDHLCGDCQEIGGGYCKECKCLRLMEDGSAFNFVISAIDEKNCIASITYDDENVTAIVEENVVKIILDDRSTNIDDILHPQEYDPANLRYINSVDDVSLLPKYVRTLYGPTLPDIICEMAARQMANEKRPFSFDSRVKYMVSFESQVAGTIVLEAATFENCGDSISVLGFEMKRQGEKSKRYRCKL